MYKSPSSCFSLFTFLSLIMALPLVVPALAQSASETYRPFMFRLAEEEVAGKTPFDEKEELRAIFSAQEQMADSAKQQVLYWNAAYPAYRWHQLMVKAGNNTPGHKNGGRMAILHLAICDALVAVWEGKRRVERESPFQLDARLLRFGQIRQYSSYICEYSAAAAAAHDIILYYFPQQKEFIDQQFEAFKKARLRSGSQYPSDISMGISIGQQIAKKYIAYAKSDRTDKTWQGTVPSDPSLWTGTPSPWDPMKRQWRPLTLERADQFRPGPPPSDWSVEMEELRNFNRQNQSSQIAWKWKSEPVWDLLLERKILAYGLDPFEAAYAAALFHSARFDATIAAWDGKYQYWGIRPFQYDPSFNPLLIETPNFPGYPAGHTTVAGALSATLAHLFPLDADEFEQLALECSESRFEGGVHFRTDNEVGLQVGKKVGMHLINSFAK